jgi:hypothetical protein
MYASEQTFHLEEYKQIRSEVAALMTRVENLFRYSLIVAATIYAWLIVQSVGLAPNGAACLKLPVALLRPGWLIPPVFVVLAAILAFAAYWRVRQMGIYLQSIEDALGIDALGWEKYLKSKKPVVTGTTIIVWLLLLAASSYATWQGVRVMEGAPLACKTEAPKQ